MGSLVSGWCTTTSLHPSLPVESEFLLIVVHFVRNLTPLGMYRDLIDLILNIIDNKNTQSMQNVKNQKSIVFLGILV